MRPIKFRAWDGTKMCYSIELCGESHRLSDVFDLPFSWMQYTGLKDRNGKEIWELCELNSRYIVTYKAPRFVLYDILNGDIIELSYENEYEITREYSPLPKDAEGSVD